MKRMRNVICAGLLSSSAWQYASGVKVLSDKHRLKQDRGSHRNFRPATGSVRGEGTIKTQKMLQMHHRKVALAQMHGVWRLFFFFFQKARRTDTHQELKNNVHLYAKVIIVHCLSPFSHVY